MDRRFSVAGLCCLALLCLCGCSSFSGGISSEELVKARADATAAVAAAMVVTNDLTPPAPPQPSDDTCENCGGTGEVGDGRIVIKCKVCGGTGKKQSFTDKLADHMIENQKIIDQFDKATEPESGSSPSPAQPEQPPEPATPQPTPTANPQPPARPHALIQMFTVPGCLPCAIWSNRYQATFERLGWTVEEVKYHDWQSMNPPVPMNMLAPSFRVWTGDRYVDHISIRGFERGPLTLEAMTQIVTVLNQK